MCIKKIKTYFMNRLCLFIYYKKNHVLYVDINTTIRELITLISEKIEIPEYLFYMVSNAKIIDTAYNYNKNITIKDLTNKLIKNESTIFIHTHTHSVPFYKKLIYFINKNGYNVDEIDFNDKRIKFEIYK